MVRVDDSSSGTAIRWEIVDGQQRLATIAMLARGIANAYEAINGVSLEEARRASDAEAAEASEALAVLREEGHILPRTARGW